VEPHWHYAARVLQADPGQLRPAAARAIAASHAQAPVFTIRDVAEEGGALAIVAYSTASVPWHEHRAPRQGNGGSGCRHRQARRPRGRESLAVPGVLQATPASTIWIGVGWLAGHILAAPSQHGLDRGRLACRPHPHLGTPCDLGVKAGIAKNIVEA
jgi:hypothetical protein